MNKVGAVLISLVALLFGCLGFYWLVKSFGHDAAGVALGLVSLSGFPICIWGAWQVWKGNVAKMTAPEALGCCLLIFYLLVVTPGLVAFSIFAWAWSLH
jgi:hypothetical protein